MKAMILGAGDSKDISKFSSFNGIKIACDRLYHECVENKINVDYVITLEDGDTIYEYFTPPHLDKKPVVVISLRTIEKTKITIGDNDFPVKIYSNELLNVCYSVGTMAWMYAWEKLGCKEIHLNGFDSLYTEKGYDLLHHLWRDMFWELHDDYCPKDVITIFDKPIERANIQRQKDSISLDRTKDYPKFTDFKNYIRYRDERNTKFIRKLTQWE